MRNIIVGTAGHIDHGKTSLIHALTGIDADRLAEEKRRGITIDLGFAHLQLTPDIRLGFVDVPGHERFIKNMLAGAAGIDFVLFVVAADESVMPQTREHFDICRLLGIQSGVIALTKSDAADSDMLELTRLEVQDLVAGSFLENAPEIPVSARTGSGLNELRAALTATAQSVPGKNAAGPARLPVDRAFTMRGFGTVITGTLISGTIQREQELMLLPRGRPLRVRFIQAYGEPIDCAVAGMRTALNVPDIEPQFVERGMSLVERGRFAATQVLDCTLQWLHHAPPLKNRTRVHFHLGTSNTVGDVRILGEHSSSPGTYLARISLENPVVAAFGDRFIVRRFSPVTTVGGGLVLNAHPAGRANQRGLRILAGNDTQAQVELLINEAEWGIDKTDVASQLSMPPEEAERLAVLSGAILLEQQSRFVDRARVQMVSQQLVQAVKEFHHAMPLEPGIARQALRNRFRLAPVYVIDAIINATADLVSREEIVRMRSHVQSTSAEEDAARQKLSDLYETSGFAVPGITESLALTNIDPERSKAILQSLLRSGTLLRLTDDLLLHASAVNKLRDILRARGGQPFTVAEFKEWAGVSRKYAVPLLEFSDRQKLTRRNGELRTVIETGAAK